MEHINKIKDKIIKSQELVISRVPSKTAIAFKEFAKDDFAGDYGLLLKHLMDFYLGLVPTGWEHLEVEIEALKDELSKIKELITNKEEDKKLKRLMNGKVVKLGE